MLCVVTEYYSLTTISVLNLKTMAENDVVILFSNVNFEYDNGKVILDEISSSLYNGWCAL